MVTTAMGRVLVLCEEFSSAMVAEGGYPVLDDTTWRRWAGKSEAVSWVRSSSAAHVVRGMQVVLLVWTHGRVKVPVGMRHVHLQPSAATRLRRRRVTMRLPRSVESSLSKDTLNAERR
jgi:hypothetical protein